MKNKDELIKEKGDFIIDIIKEIMISKDIFKGYFRFEKIDNDYVLRIWLESNKIGFPKGFEIKLNDIYEYDADLAEYFFNYFLDNYIDNETIGVSDIEIRDFALSKYYSLNIVNLNGSKINMSYFHIKNYNRFYELMNSYNKSIKEFANKNTDKVIKNI